MKKIPVGRYLYVTDVLCWNLAILLAAIFNHNFHMTQVSAVAVTIGTVCALVLQLLTGTWLHLYRKGSRFRMGSFEDTIALTLSTAVVGFTMWIISLLLTDTFTYSHAVVFIATALALIFMVAVRALARIAFRNRVNHSRDATPTIVYGGGHNGVALINWMTTNLTARYAPVGIIDDDEGLRHERIGGVRVFGGIDTLEYAINKTGACVIILAVGEPPQGLIDRVAQITRRHDIKLKIMPPVREMIDGGVRGRDIRNVSIEDMLGREPVDTNVSEIVQYLTNKRVLVTGAGGSIGSQLCKEINKYGPAELMMLDRDETGLQQVAIDIVGNGLLNTDEIILADIRDEEALLDIFQRRRPEVVFHAAALKHLPALEQYPSEAWKTNVLGTLNVLKAAESVDVDTFVNISTDKAANPTSALGHSKRAAEKLTSWFSQKTHKKYLSVRFGNVIGSRGSMLPTFIRLIEEDKPLTVTHPEATRFFMTIPEACQLVLQAGGIGSSGEVLILDMGEPVSILNIAQRMIALSGKDLDIVFTGLREGEKLHEELVGDGEAQNRPHHPKISHTVVEGLSEEELDKEAFLHSLSSYRAAEETAAAEAPR